MVQVVPHEVIPPEVYLYLLPSEKRVITVRRHPMVFLPTVLLVAVSLAAFALTAADIRSQPIMPTLFGVLLIASGLLLYQHIRTWLKAYVVFTSARILLINIKWRRPLVVIPLSVAYMMTFRRLTPFRPFSLEAPYGSFIIRKDGSCGRAQKITYLPYPEQIYIEVCGLLFPDLGVPS